MNTAKHRFQITPAILLIAVWILMESASCGQSTEELLQNLQSSDVELQARAAEKLGKAGSDVVAPLAKILESDRPAAVEAARGALRAIAHQAARPGSEDRAGAEKAFAGALEGATSARAKNALLEILSFIGSAESVPAIASALGIPETHHMACLALSRIDAPQAAQVLREALEEKGNQGDELQIALLNAIGKKQDMAAAQLLSDVVQDSGSDEVCLAALEALSRNPMCYAYLHVFWEASTSLKTAENPRRRSRIRDCLLRIGEAFIEVGEFGNASDLFGDLLRNSKTTAEKCSVIIALGRASRREAPDLVFEALVDKDPAVRSTAVTALEYLRWGMLSAGLKRTIPKASPQMLADILGSLSRREEPEVGELAASFLAHEDGAVRAAALGAMEGRSSGAAAGALIQAIEAGGPAATEGAAGVLARMPGADVTQMIREAAEKATSEAGDRLQKVLVLRKNFEA